VAPLTFTRKRLIFCQRTKIVLVEAERNNLGKRIRTNNIGYLYHLDAMSDPFWPGYPQELLNKIGPRNMVHSWAMNTDDATVMPRWGKIGKQKIEDAGALPPKCMETVDDEILKHALAFVDKAKKDNKPFFL
jgi:predicted DNA-binding WGR domain protein